MTIVFIIAFILILSMGLAGKSFAPWVPVWSSDLPRIFKLANLNPGEIFYDLGCGNGKTVIYANKNFKAKAIGLEMAIPLYLTCKLRQLFNYDKNLIFKFKNLFKENLSQADVIYIFGMPDKLKNKLRLKFEKELKKGTKVISYVFPIEGWQPKIIDKPNPKNNTIYLYII